MNKVDFLIAIHCHQPVGNFASVFSEAYEKAYLPFIEVLKRHPKVKLSLHYSGSLIDWLEAKHPEFLNDLKKLVKSGQVEIIAGGYFEPILALIPQRDAVSQINLFRKKISDLFGISPTGCWTTERVWEPSLPEVLENSGIIYTIIDDSHFQMVGLNPEVLSGFYVTEEKGNKLYVFPSSEKLRYYLPFKLANESINYFRQRLEEKGSFTITYGDDGEKFGLWPGTYKWVYEEKWLESFFAALDENSDWINTVTFSQYLAKNSPAGRVYLPCASYREMMVWSNGYFRNFLVKYSESYHMYKRMLLVSKKVNGIADSLVNKPKTNTARTKDAKAKKIEEARSYLYMSQANDAYWHGVFGGLYLGHLRSSVYANLINSEKAIDSLMLGDSYCKLENFDFDTDGNNEVIINTPNFGLYFRPKEGGILAELDYKPKAVNLSNTLMRRAEPYHKKIKEKLEKRTSVTDDSLPKSIHDISSIKEAGLENQLFYDAYPRASLIDHFLDSNTHLTDFLRSRYTELGDFANGLYEANLSNKEKSRLLRLNRKGRVRDKFLKLSKSIGIKDNTLSINYEFQNTKEVILDTIFGIEFNLSIYEPVLSKTGSLENINRLELNDQWFNVKLRFSLDRASSLWHFPIETVSDSERGMEKTYQGLCLFFFWNNINFQKIININLKLEIS